MLDWLKARDIVLEHARCVTPVEMALTRAAGRILAADMHAGLDLPPFDNSAVDGYAVQRADVGGANEGRPVVLKKIGVIGAGGSGPALKVSLGECAQISTGAPVPPGADAVVMQEWCEDDAMAVRVRKPVRKGENVRPAGDDVKTGSLILKDGTRLSPAAVGLLASQGYMTVNTYPQPRVAILATGEELVAPGSPRTPAGIYESNTAALTAALAEIGVSPSLTLRVKDEPNETKVAIERGLAHSDILIISGGMSVGAFDFVRPALEEIGVRRLFWQIALKPGKPFYFGIFKDSVLVFGLPGNPVSTLVCFYEFIRPAVLKMMGRADILLQECEAILEEKIERQPGRFEFMRGICEKGDGEWRVRSAGRQGSHIYSSFVAANCFILISEDVERLPGGSRVTIQILRCPLCTPLQTEKQIPRP
ncbi:MAG: molybdopterin molybdotransferase MoeA [bacterium]